jgi:hypothetical protein
VDNPLMHQDVSSRDTRSEANGLLDPSGRLWLACFGLVFIVASLAIKEVNTLMFLMGSIFALISFNGTRFNSITLGKDQVTVEMNLTKRLAELNKVTEIKLDKSDATLASLFSELSKPFNAGIRTEGYGLAQLINANEQVKAEMLREIRYSSGVTGISKHSIVGVGRVQDPQSYTKLVALMSDGSNYILDYPKKLTEAIGNTLKAPGDNVVVYPSSFTDAIKEDRGD